MKKWVKTFVTIFWRVIAVAIITLAVIVVIGREFAPYIDRYRPHIESYLSEKLDANVSMSSIAMTWERLSISLDINDFVMSKTQPSDKLDIPFDAYTPSLSVKKAAIEIDLLASITQWRLAFKSLSLDNAHIAISQSANGLWNLSGYENAANHNNDLSMNAAVDPGDWFLRSREVALSNAQVSLLFRQGESAQINANSITIENDQNFHRLKASIAIADQPDRLQLIIESKGDLRDRKDFSAQGFLELNNFSAERFLELIPSHHLDVMNLRWQEASNLDLKLWLSFPETNVFDVTGSVAFTPGELAVGQQKISLLNPLSTEFHGQVTLEKGFNLAFRNTQLESSVHTDLALPPLILHSDDFSIVTLTAGQFTLDPWMVWLNGHPSLPEPASKVLNRLQVSGQMEYLSFGLDTKDWLQSSVTAKADKVSIGNGMQIPLMKSLSGFFTGSVSSGAIIVESTHFSFHSMALFEQPLEADFARGQLAWSLSPNDNQFAIYSQSLEAGGSFGTMNSQVLVDLPLVNGSRAAELTIAAGIENTSSSQARLFLPTKKVPENLTQWLDDSIGDSTIRSAGFVYRGSLKANATAADRSFQLYLDIEDGNLRYSPDWPALTDVTGQAVLDNSEFIATIDSAKSLSASLTNARAYWPGQWRKQAKQLHITGHAGGTVSDALTFVKQSPLQDNLGKVLEGWQGSGAINGALDLRLGFNNAASQYRVETTFKGNQLTLPYGELKLDKLRGQIFYDSRQGISSKSLKATLFGAPTTAQLSQEGSTTVIDWQGSLKVDSLIKTLNHPLLSYLSGGTDYQGKLSAGDDVFKLSLSSNLKGLSSSLPSLFNKAEGSHWPSQLEATYQQGLWTGSATVNDHIRLGSIKSSKRETKQYLTVNAPVPSQFNEQITIVSKLPLLNVNQWLPLVKAVSAEQKGAGSNNPLTTSFAVSIQADEFTHDSIYLKNLTIDSRYVDKQWSIAVESPKIKGLLSQQELAPWQLNLDTLDWPLTHHKDLVSDDVGATVKPPFNHRDIPSMNVRVDNFFLNEKRLGSLNFNLDSQDKGLIVNNIQGILVGDIAIVDKQSSFTWFAESNQNHFVTMLEGGSMQPLLSVWGIDDMIENDSASIAIDVKWPGQPSDFSLQKLTGRAAVSLDDGQFLKTDNQASTDFLRLLGVLNFDTLARRLRLDFSDLYKTGLTFDKVDGRFAFANGIIQLSDTIDVKAPSSELSMSGSINMNNKTLDLTLKATLPVTGNLTLVTALAAGLPAAAGVYVFGKVFKNQVDKVSTITYNIVGPWREPIPKQPVTEPEEINPYDEFDD